MKYLEMRKKIASASLRTLLMVLVAVLALHLVATVLSHLQDRATMRAAYAGQVGHLQAIEARLGALPPAFQAAIEQADVLQRADSRLEAIAVDTRKLADASDAEPYRGPPESYSQPITTTCGARRSCTGTFFVQGRCNGRDQVPIWQQAWEAVPIKITAVSVGLALDGRLSIAAYAIVGNSAHPDIMAQQIGSGTNTVHLSPPFDFPATRDENTHLDVHIGCRDGSYSSWAVIYYTKSEP